MSLRALTLVDVLQQLQQDSGEVVAFNADEVTNQLQTDTETLVAGSETFTETQSTDYPVNIIQDAGPILYRRLDDPVSSTTVFDSNPWASSTYPKITGTVNGGVTFQVTGAMTGSKAATFNGTSGYLESANTTSLQRVGDLTIEMWFKATNLTAAQTLISKGTTGEFHLRLETNGSISLLMGPAYNTVIVPAATISAGTWYHLVVVRTALGKTIASYVNGVAKFSGTYTTAPSTTTNVLRLGATSPGTAANFFGGQLDEVALYQRTLTATQVTNHYTWGTASNVTCLPYGVAKYGYEQYPAPGSVAGSLYGSVTYGGGATYQ